jgi:hypothetical protein
MAASKTLTPEQRSLRARLAAQVLHATVDSKAHTAAARAASPGSLGYWEEKVDPASALDPEERARRATSARSAHFTRLAYESSRARGRRAK